MTLQEQLLTVALLISEDQNEYSWFRAKVERCEWDLLYKVFSRLEAMYRYSVHNFAHWELLGFQKALELAKQGLYYYMKTGITNYAETKFRDLQKHYL